MGAWGPGIFSDDTAQDVRTSYRQLIEDGASGEEATRSLVEQFADMVGDTDDGPVFWIALAATLGKPLVGRLLLCRGGRRRGVGVHSDLRRWNPAGAYEKCKDQAETGHRVRHLSEQEYSGFMAGWQW